MGRLYTQIAGSIILAVIVGWTTVALFMPRLQAFIEQSLSEQLLASGLRAAGARMNATTQAAWPDELAQLRRDITLPLTVMARADLPAEIAPDATQPTLARRPGDDGISIFIPLASGAHFLVAGPLERPPVAPVVTISVIFVVVLTATASAFVGIPLVRRLRTVRRALTDIGGGNWATRLDANAEGALRELAESVNTMAAQLEQQFQEREALLQAVSHEMGTPLSRIRFRLEHLEQAAPEAERKSLQGIADDLDDLDALSAELVSWMETAPAQQTRRWFDARQVLESLIELECQTPGTTIQTTLDAPPAPVRVHADQRQFERVMENLLRNALRYASKHVVVAVHQEQDAVVVEVRDDGPGIPADERARVFEPFVRGTTPASRAHRGLGLGLAIVRRIVAAHGGSVTVTDAKEGGAAFRTLWPHHLNEN